MYSLLDNEHTRVITTMKKLAMFHPLPPFSTSKTLWRKLKNALCYVRLIDLFPVKNFSIKKTFNRFISPSLKSFSSWPSFLYQIELQIVYFLFFLSENFFLPKANSWKYTRKGNDIAYFRFLGAFIFLPITWWL